MPADVPARHHLTVGHDNVVIDVPAVAGAGADQLDPFHTIT